MAEQVVDTSLVPLGSDGVMEVVWKVWARSDPHPWVVFSALTALRPVLSLFNFYPDNFPSQIVFLTLSTFLTMT